LFALFRYRAAAKARQKKGERGDVTDVPLRQPPHPAQMAARRDAGWDRITVEFPDPAPQNRLTVLARLAFATPHLIALWALGLASDAVVVIGWFGALFAGRLPEFTVDYLSGYLRWQTRVYAYLLLLTGQYPPFTFDDDGYPVRLTVRPGRLNRLAVLFRMVLGIPAMILADLLAFGLILLTMFVIWLIVIFAGRMPGTAHQALAAVVRYFARFFGYMLLLTSEYPRGLFGEQGPDAFPPGPAYPGQAPVTAAAAAPGLLVLPEAAKRLVGVFLGLGTAGLAGYVVLVVALAGGGSAAMTRKNAINQVQASYTTLSRSLGSVATKTTACAHSGDELACVTRVDHGVAEAFTSFASSVRSTPMPSSGSAAAADQLAAAATRAGGLFQHLASATTIAQYLQAASGSATEQVMAQVGTDYQSLGAALNAS
jgi:Domain of unknown function (DUF4389)